MSRLARGSSEDRACALYERAVASRAAGRPEAACRAAREAIEVFRRLDGPRSPDAANMLLELSTAERDLGRYARSLASARRAWRILSPLRGGQDLARLKANALGCLASAHVSRGEYAEARRVQLRSLAKAETLGPADVLDPRG